MGIEVFVPSYAAQKQLVALKVALEKSAAIRAKQQVLIEALLPALCHQTLSNHL